MIMIFEDRKGRGNSTFCSVSVKVMDFQDHVCIANKPERTILHLQRQRNAALRKSEQPSVNSGLGFGRKIVEIKAKNV